MSSDSGAADADAGHDQGASVIACAVVLPVLAAVAIGLRFYVRAILLRAVKIEDWLILVAWVCSSREDTRHRCASSELISPRPLGLRRCLRSLGHHG